MHKPLTHTHTLDSYATPHSSYQLGVFHVLHTQHIELRQHQFLFIQTNSVRLKGKSDRIIINSIKLVQIVVLFNILAYHSCL